MDLLIIDPPYRSLKGMPTDRAYNIGPASLAAYLRREGIETAVVTGDLLLGQSSRNHWLSQKVSRYAAGQREYERVLDDKGHAVWQALKETISEARPLAVGIPYLTPLKHVVERIAALTREVNPDIRVIAGAFHPTFCPEEVMRNPDIDFVIRGEGEVPLLALMREMKKGMPEWDTVPGLHYRDKDGQVKNTPAPPLIDNLDALPFPARELVLNTDYDRYRVHSISSARGCPYTCAFCSDRRLWGSRVRRRSVESVIAELKHLKAAFKVDFVEFVDGTFTFDRKYLEKFCNALIDQKLDIPWRCTARYDNLDSEILRLMKRADCCGLYLGLESGSDSILAAVDKKTTVRENVRVSRMVYESGIPSGTAVILGLPGESLEDMTATLELMKDLKTDIFDVNSYIPLPGTPLYDAMSEADREAINWRKVGFKSFDNYFIKSASREDFRECLSRAYRIADRVRQKTILRFALRKLRDFPAKALRAVFLR